MRMQSILLTSLLAALCGCQPEAPAPQAAAPAAPPAATTEPVAAPAPQAVPAATEKTSQSAAAEKTAQPAPVAAAPAVKAEPAVVGVKPEAKAAPAISEAEGLQLAKKSNCLACHAIDKKVVGPAWKDVAARYRGDAGAEARLMDKIAKGGSGVWGVVPMPPSPQVGEADRRTLARFVLSLK